MKLNGFFLLCLFVSLYNYILRAMRLSIYFKTRVLFVPYLNRYSSPICIVNVPAPMLSSGNVINSAKLTQSIDNPQLHGPYPRPPVKTIDPATFNYRRRPKNGRHKSTSIAFYQETFLRLIRTELKRI